MKTTIEIKDELFYRAKEVALQRRTTFRAIIEDALVIAITEQDETTPNPHPLRGIPVTLHHPTQPATPEDTA